jgi:CRP/FNR family transcriptional regulator
MANPKQALAYAGLQGITTARSQAAALPGLANRCLPVRSFKKGAWILTQGDPLDALYILQEGSILLTRLSASGRETIIGFVAPGEYFGDVPLLDGHIASFNALALQASALLVVRKSDFNLLLEDAAACRSLMGVLARRCNDAWTQIEILGNSLLEDKVRIMLNWLIKRIGVQTPEGTQIRISQSQLAKMVGSSRESLNRRLGILKEEGIIRIKGKYPQTSLLIVDPDRLSLVS